MRVIAGSAKGRRLKAPDTLDTRPILDRVKTALFDILAPDIVDSRFLDLFAGTGQIGIEALSRGAEAATFVEMSGEIIKLIRENLAITRLEANAEVIRADAFAFLRDARAQDRHYDIVYVAPPQYKQMAAQALERLDRAPLTAPGGLVIVQIHPRERPDIAAVALSRLRLYDERTYGSTLLMFFEHPDVDAAQPPSQDTSQDTSRDTSQETSL
ncbi:MAG TPA: 16S rRNA (guanine(966)-N(2))-methyltransferase RsmD [Ktedonobacterales bacterium]|jgi:16S rRNA (guanine(966)-N(2))-methyltransferase RsmD|nr:16S rRNA (guanine(966)-N(2))-methyltransferase RsmD [Ktedonobacterales bacterium]